MPSVSLTMIVRDEEKNLAACLAPVSLLVDEIVIVDTGSTDRTKEIAAAARDKHGQPAKVFDFPWIDDFSAARNESLRHATGDFVFWMDADDRVDAANATKLGALFGAIPPDPRCAYVLQTVCGQQFGSIAISHTRLFPRRPGVEWRRRIHESIAPSLQELGIVGFQFNAVEIRHDSYLEPTTSQRRQERNLRLLRMQLDETPDDLELLIYLASELASSGRRAEAMASLERVVSAVGDRRDEPFDTYLVRAQMAMVDVAAAGGNWRRVALIEQAFLARGDEDGRQAYAVTQRLYPAQSRT